MKINLISENEQSIDGYENINIIDNLDFMEEIFEHSCEEVIVNNCMSALSQEEADNLLTRALSKVSVNGTLVIKFIDFKLMAESLYNLTVSKEEFNQNILSKVRSVNSLSDIFSMLSNFGFDTNIDLKSCWCGYIIETARV